MSRFLPVIFSGLLLALPVLPALAQRVSVTDFSGREVSLAAPAKRIVTLAPHSAENLFSAGAGAALVGTVSGSDFPPETAALPVVGKFNAYSLEAIAALQPDLIVMWGSGNGARTLSKLAVLGIPVFVSEPRQLGDISRDIRSLGILAGTAPQSEVAARRIEDGLDQLKETYRQLSPLDVFYEIWNDPLQTINGKHLISQVIDLCGGRNIFADVGTLAPRVNVESVLALAPDAIIASGMSATRPQWLDEWRRYPGLPAVAGNGLFFIDPDLLERPTARILEGATILCQQLDTLRE